jgi:uncharacterized protein (TIGR02453 family)
MPKSFPGFSPKALTFFRQLEKNNDRDWFAAHKEIYETQVRAPMVELTAMICEEFRKFAIDYVPEKPEKAIYRIYRDTRFSKDKTPYKTHIGTHLQHRRIPKNAGAGFYFQISHEGVGIGGGIYMPGPEQLQAVRQKIAAKWQELAKICADRAVVKALGEADGAKLTRVPKGFDPESPAAKWLCYKQLYHYIELPTKVVTSPMLYKQILIRLKLLVPLNQFLNEAIIRAVGEGQPDRPVRPEPMF